MQNSELTQNLRALCLPGGRLSGTDNAFIAERYVLDKARDYGLRNGHLEAFAMPCWRATYTLSCGGRSEIPARRARLM